MFVGQYCHAYRLVLMFLDICQYALFLTNLFLFYSVCKQSLWDEALQVKSNGEEIYETELSGGNFLKTLPITVDFGGVYFAEFVGFFFFVFLF